jgi:excisionase family DNA binding protein
MTKGRRPEPRIEHLATHPRAYVSVRALAAYLECDPRTITGLIADKVLHAFKVGRQWRIPIEAACELCHVERQRIAS